MSITRGADLMQRLNDGSLQQAPSAYLEKTRTDITAAIEELLDIGARIRPLLVNEARVGWVRGVLPSERKALQRWITDDVEMIEHLLLLGTTLTIEEIRDLNMLEMRSLSRIVRAMTESDLKLYAYIGAFVTTGTSEQLWYSKGTSIANFRDRVVCSSTGCAFVELSSHPAGREGDADYDSHLHVTPLALPVHRKVLSL